MSNTSKTLTPQELAAQEAAQGQSPPAGPSNEDLVALIKAQGEQIAALQAAQSAPVAASAKAKPDEAEVTVVMQEIRNIGSGRTEMGPRRTQILSATTFDRFMKKDETDRNIFDSLPDKVVEIHDPREKAKSKTK